MVAKARQERADVLVGVRHLSDVSRYGRVEVSGTRIVRFTEKGVGGPGLINSGIYVVRRSVFEGRAPGSKFSFEQGILVPGVWDYSIRAHEISGMFIDIGVPSDYEQAQVVIPRWAGRIEE